MKQRVEEDAGDWIEEKDLRKKGEEEREGEIREMIREEQEREYDLGRGPQIRVKLVRKGEEEHVLMGSMHHIVSDGWSVGVMMREIREGYEREERRGSARRRGGILDYAACRGDG